MANLVVPVNVKRKDAEVASHGFCILIDPKRAKLQDADIPVMMEEEEPHADADVDAPSSNVQPTMFLPIQGQVALNDCTVGSKCSEQTFSAYQAEPMDADVDLQQYPVLKQQHAPFFSGLF